MEKIIASPITVFTETKRLISNCQYAVLKHLSPEIALVEQEEFIVNLEERFLTLGVFIDYINEFDSINHALLLQKLTNYSIRG